MHSYLKSIGFSACNTKKKEEKLINEIINSATRRSQISLNEKDESQYVELSMDFAEDIGVTVRGQYDSDDVFHLDHYFPYLRPRQVATTEELFVGKRSDSDSYAVLCDDLRVGISLIFFLQNSVDYLRNNPFTNNSVTAPTKLSCLASEGTILFPTMKSMKDIEDSGVEINRHSQMLSEAKNGNQEAIDKLTLQEIDAFSLLGKRIKNEDVFSIVDTSFAPYGMESEVYKIIGIILSLEERVNRVTDEKLYVMEIYCNHLIFDLCVCEKDLLGEPEVGRRFRGVIWLQGKIEFTR